MKQHVSITNVPHTPVLKYKADCRVTKKDSNSIYKNNNNANSRQMQKGKREIEEKSQLKWNMLTMIGT